MLEIFGYTTDLANSGFRQVDLLGNIVKETNVERLNQQLQQLNARTITVVHHEARRLDNGYYLILGMTEQISDAQGPGLDIAGDMIILLDPDLNIRWFWDAFDHLDITRKAVLNETCATVIGGCVLFLASVANDWTHGNSVALTPDGNLIYSSRHQDWVFKIDFQSGEGDGHVIWRLGKDGDFTWQSTDPFPWFSHQHDPEFEDAGLMSVFDNGNTRVVQDGSGNSRGQVLSIDQQAMTVTPILNADLQTYSSALGSAERLSNGNHSFNAGYAPGLQSYVPEVTTSGDIVAQMHVAAQVYRSFRMRDLYTGE